MKEAEEASAYGRTNWRKFAIAAGIPAVGAAGLLLAVQQGALAASFTISGQSYTLTADSLYGKNFAQFGGIDKDANSKGYSSAIGNHPTAVSTIGTATIHNMCQSVVSPLPWGGAVTLKITAGTAATGKPDDDTNAVTATDLVIGMTDLSGDASFNGMQIGTDAGPLGGTPGGFGQSADNVTITNLSQTALSTSAGQFNLKGMHLQVLMGDQTCK